MGDNRGAMKPTLSHALFAAAAVALSGCGDDGVRPVPRDAGDTSFEVRSVPLAVGSRWSYAFDYTNEWFSDAGINLPPPVHLTATGTRTLVETETLDGRDYVVEWEVVSAKGGTPTERWRRYRQDEAALYRASVSLAAAPGEVDTGGDPVDDLTRLVFPLEVGLTWTQLPGNPSPSFEVESLDTLSLAIGDVPAFRVRVDVASDGDDDYRLLWFGVQGLLRRHDHHEIMAIDGATNEVVRIVSDEVEEVTEVQLPQLQLSQPARAAQ